MTVIRFSCTCGEVGGSLDVPGPEAGNHLTCHCPDCRASAIHLGQPDPGAEAGTELWQTTPDHLSITHGAEYLAIQQLSPRGPFRWYARCCNTPLFNTLRSPRLAFVGVLADRLDDTAPLGPLIGRAFLKGANGRYRHEAFNRMGLRVLRMILLSNLTGRWRNNPLFGSAGRPIAPVGMLSRDARAAATPR